MYKADRLFRSLRHMVLTLDELAALGIAFVSVTEPFDTLTPSGKLLLHIVSAIRKLVSKPNDRLCDRAAPGDACLEEAVVRTEGSRRQASTLTLVTSRRVVAERQRALWIGSRMETPQRRCDMPRSDATDQRPLPPLEVLDAR